MCYHLQHVRLAQVSATCHSSAYLFMLPDQACNVTPQQPKCCRMQFVSVACRKRHAYLKPRLESADYCIWAAREILPGHYILDSTSTSLQALLKCSVHPIHEVLQGCLPCRLRSLQGCLTHTDVSPVIVPSLQKS